ncbi:glycosyltransferase family 2 protein [Scrofimicrobium sp. R131]|uniref:glycosyltransferase family 2 protein n=1 Tax=Scrofimicrobium appendicitidis TaxID=3079930 RepID=UPI003305CDEA
MLRSKSRPVSTSNDQVDIIIACHDPGRRLQRAIESVLSSNGTNVGVIVVAHNLPIASLSETVPAELRDRVRWLQCADGIHSPAGPFNLGLAASRAEWVGLLGSDDYLEPGAVDRWLQLSSGADAVIARLRHDSGGAVHTPPVRPVPHRRRTAVADRLYYRSAPLGLTRRTFLTSRHIVCAEGLTTGEDLTVSIPLWTWGRVRVQRSGPSYVIGSDASNRVTMRLAPLKEELRHTEVVWRSSWMRRLSVGQRRALGTKYLRIHFFGAAYYRATSGHWSEEDRRDLAQAIKLVLELAPGCHLPLSRIDRQLLAALADPTTPVEELNRLAIARRRFGQVDALIPADWRYLLHREAPLRFMAASFLTR